MSDNYIVKTDDNKYFFAGWDSIGGMVFSQDIRTAYRFSETEAEAKISAIEKEIERECIITEDIY